MNKHIKFYRDKGETLPMESVTTKMVQTPRPILQESMDLLIPLVMRECCLNDEWQQSGIIRNLSLKWATGDKYSVNSILISLKREQKQEVVLAMPKISMDYLTDETKNIIDKILAHAKQYLEGKYAQLELPLPSEPLPPLQPDQDEIGKKRAAKAKA